MSTTQYLSAARPAPQLEIAKRERCMFGPGHVIAFTDAPFQGTSAPALIQTSGKDNPAAAAMGGDASGFRLWRYPV